MKFLWVEDNVKKGDFKKYGLDEKYTEIKTTLRDALEYIHYNYEKFDTVILDIDLDLGDIEEGNIYEKYLKDIVPKEQHKNIKKQEAGFFIFLKLLYNGFPVDRIVFLTANISKKTDLDYEWLMKIDSADELFNNNEKLERFIGNIKNVSLAYQLTLNKLIKENKTDEAKKIINNILNKYKPQSKQTYDSWSEKFSSAGMVPPGGFRKEEEIVNFIKWKNSKITDYYILRRAIINCCNMLKEKIQNENYDINGINDSFIIFPLFFANGEVDKKVLFNKDYFKKLLSTIEGILPLRIPADEHIKKNLYENIIRNISHHWEAVVVKECYYSYRVKKEEIKDEFLKKVLEDAYAYNLVMKTLRNWQAHNTITDFSEGDVAFIFIIAMRIFFKLSNEVYEYEKLLLSLIEEEPINHNDLKAIINGPNMGLRKRLINSYKTLYHVDKFNKEISIKGIINNLGKNYKKYRGIERNMNCLFRLFWHGKFNEFIDTGMDNKIEIRFNFNNNRIISEENIVCELFRYTYKRAFLF